MPETSRRFILRHALLAAWLLPSAAGLATSALAQSGGGLEAPAVQKAEDVLPAELIRGPHHTVDPTVHVYALMREYRVRSEFGDYVVVGDARLRTLVRELAAIAELRKIKKSDAFAEATKNALTGPIRGARNLIDDPAATLSGIPEATGEIFSRIGEQLRRGRRSQYEDSTAAAVLAVSSFKRDLARKLAVDVYSTNEALQKELNSVAWASAAGNLSLGALSMATGAVVLQVAGYARTLEQAKGVIAAEPPAQISRRSRAALTAMAMPPDLIDRFLAHRSYSPRHQYLIVTALESMRGVADRRRLLEAALGVQTEGGAYLFQRLSDMMAAYHQAVRPISRITTEYGFPVGIVSGGGVVVLAPFDHVLWAELPAQFVSRLPVSGGRARSGAAATGSGEIWLTGDASERTRGELARRGYSLHPRSGQQLPLAD
ncbi:MAG: hypothetical protein AB7P02_13395 [Alphaproteobacteria bacterium]